MTINNNQKEWRLLVRACHAAIQSTDDFIFKDSLEHINYEVLRKLARYHKVVPLLQKGLSKHPDKATIPSDFLDLLKRQSFNFAIRNLKNAKELLRLHNLFKEANIEIIPYKGVVLSEMAYGELGVRESSDIDILVQKKDLDLLYTILESEGYVPAEKMSNFFYNILLKFYNEYNYDLYEGQTRLFHVEPHWVLGSKMHQIYIDYNSVYPLTKEGDLLNTKINKLTPEGLLITTFVHHGTSDGWLYLKNVTDIAAILTQYETSLDWKFIISTSKQLKILNILLLGLGLSQTIYKSILPLEIQTLLSQRKIANLIEKHKIILSTISERPHYAYAFYKRIIYQFNLRASWTTKIKVVYYHLLHFILKPFLSK